MKELSLTDQKRMSELTTEYLEATECGRVEVIDREAKAILAKYEDDDV